MTLDVMDLGRKPYPEVWKLQKVLLAERSAGSRPDTLLLVEHEPVYTRGASARKSPPPNLPYPVYDVERGGDVTFHGHGHLVGYPIIDLSAHGLLVGAYLRRLESMLIAACAALGAPGERVAGRTGVWSSGKKLASIGVAVRGWIAYHGFSVNVGGDLAPFQAIRPCGFPASVISTVSAAAGREIGLPETKTAVVKSFRGFFSGHAGNPQEYIQPCSR